MSTHAEGVLLPTHSTPMSSSQSGTTSGPTGNLFVDSEGRPLRVFVEASTIHHAPIVRILKKNGATMCIAPMAATILIVDLQSECGPRFAEDWGGDQEKIILEIAWVNTCVEHGRAMLEVDGWSNCQVTPETLSTGQSPGSSQDMEEGASATESEVKHQAVAPITPPTNYSLNRAGLHEKKAPASHKSLAQATRVDTPNPAVVMRDAAAPAASSPVARPLSKSGARNLTDMTTASVVEHITLTSFPRPSGYFGHGGLSASDFAIPGSMLPFPLVSFATSPSSSSTPTRALVSPALNDSDTATSEKVRGKQRATDIDMERPKKIPRLEKPPAPASGQKLSLPLPRRSRLTGSPASNSPTPLAAGARASPDISSSNRTSILPAHNRAVTPQQQSATSRTLPVPSAADSPWLSISPTQTPLPRRDGSSHAPTAPSQQLTRDSITTSSTEPGAQQHPPSPPLPRSQSAASSSSQPAPSTQHAITPHDHVGVASKIFVDDAGAPLPLFLQTDMRGRAELAKVVRANGGTFSSIISASAAVLQQSGSLYKVSRVQAAQSAVPAVSPQWVRDCVQAGRLLEFKDYLLGADGGLAARLKNAEKDVARSIKRQEAERKRQEKEKHAPEAEGSTRVERRQEAQAVPAHPAPSDTRTSRRIATKERKKKRAAKAAKAAPAPNVATGQDLGASSTISGHTGQKRAAGSPEQLHVLKVDDDEEGDKLDLLQPRIRFPTMKTPRLSEGVDDFGEVYPTPRSDEDA